MATLLTLRELRLASKVAVGAVAIALVGSGCTASKTPEEPEKVTVREGGKRPGAAFVHLFEWKWTDVAKECETFLGPKGFAAVQVSPPMEHALLPGRPWWQRYQPVSYDLVSRSGNEVDFEDMVTRCNAVGVHIYVDAVINHMTAQDSGTGSNGHEFTKYEYEGLYTEADFHSPHCTIDGADYTTNGDNVQSCELLGLSDLNTADPSVQQKLAAYLVRMVDLGVRGFRIDAAKHMAPADVQAIIALVSEAVGAERAPYYFLEVIDQGGEAIEKSDYAGVAGSSGSVVDITEFAYAAIGDNFLGKDGDKLSELLERASAATLLPSDRAVVFSNNHDTQRNNAIFYQDGAAHDLANVFLLAYPYGYPQLISSYAFDRTSDAGRSEGPPSDAEGNTTSIYADGSDVPSCAANSANAPIGSWVCEHRSRTVANMVGFRRAAADSAVTHVWTNDENQLAFGREGTAFVVLNGEGAPLEQSLATDLPAGKYCDVLSGELEGGTCTGAVIEVGADGAATFQVAPHAAAAIHVEARPK
jgi:alpha-amylase